MASGQLTSTSYALLGLLALRPWTTYEMCRQMGRSLHFFWPRAESNIYAGARVLVEHGLAAAEPAPHGRRQRSVYRITPAGQTALEAWLAEPGRGPVLEFEALLKVFYAERTSRATLLAHLAGIRDWAAELEAVNRTVADEYRSGRGKFPQRLAVIMLTSGFLWMYAETVRSWVDWAQEEVESWPEDPSAWPDDPILITRALGPFLQDLAPASTGSSGGRAAG